MNIVILTIVKITAQLHMHVCVRIRGFRSQCGQMQVSPKMSVHVKRLLVDEYILLLVPCDHSNTLPEKVEIMDCFTIIFFTGSKLFVSHFDCS